MASLTELDLSRNRFVALPWYEGDMELMKRTNDFFAGVHLLSNLRALDLRANALTEWPRQLEMCVFLADLKLAANRFKSLPPELGLAMGLTALDLSHNRLAALPDAVSQLSALEVLSTRARRRRRGRG